MPIRHKFALISFSPISTFISKTIEKITPNLAWRQAGLKYPDKLIIPENQRSPKLILTIIKKTFGALKPGERKIIFGLLIIIIASLAAIFYNFWNKNTTPVPAAGGTLTEGVIGSPRYINPILSQTNEVDMDLARLTFSSLFTFSDSGELINDIAESYTLSDDKKTYTIKIKNNILWHDGEKLTADDVVFTIKTIQNPRYKSLLRGNLATIEAEKTGDFEIKLSLKTPYEPFLQNLAFGILPQHIWKYISADNAPLAEYNIKPIGSGPYKLDKITKEKSGIVTSIELIANNKYYSQKPLIENITFKFYKDQTALLEALNNEQINATAYLNNENNAKVTRKDIKNIKYNTTQYSSVFFNQNNAKILADINIRLALNYLTDKDQIIKEALLGNAQKSNTPIPPIFPDYNSQTKDYAFDLSFANSLLEKAGWVIQADNIRVQEVKEKVKDPKTKKTTEVIKEKIPLELELTVSDLPEPKKIAELIQSQWQKGGVRVNLKFLSPYDIESAIKNRDYDAILFGETLNINPDPFIFWHSSKAEDPGLNLAMYSNKNADSFLEDYRQEFDPAKKKGLLAKFQAAVVDDAPAVFLFNPYLNYIVADEIKTINDSNQPPQANSGQAKITAIRTDRLNSISDWYIATKRVWGKK